MPAGKVNEITLQQQSGNTNMKYNHTILLTCLLAATLSCSCTSTKKDTSSQTSLLSQETKNTHSRRTSPIEAPDYSKEIDTILNLARANKWAEAEKEAAKLMNVAPNDPSVLRVYTWVKKENTARKETELESKLRDISGNGTRTNPDIIGVLTNKKTDGLSPRSDLREAIEAIKDAPLIPETFGKVIETQGTLHDIDDELSMNVLLDKDITLQVSDVTLRDIIFNIGKTENINFVADQALAAMDTKLTMNVKNWKLGKFLRYVGKNLNINFQIGSDVIWISDASDPAKLKNIEEVKFYKLKHGIILPAQFGADNISTTSVTANGVTTVTQSEVRERFVQDGVPINPALESAINTFCEGITIQFDTEHNIIIARGTYEQHAILQQLIEELDKPIQQVLIEARFITVSEPAFMQLGIDWSTVTGDNPTTTQDFTGMGSAYGLGKGLSKQWTSVFGTDDLNATLYAIEQSGESQTLSSPRILAVNNLPARFSDGKIQYYYSEYTVTQQMTDRSSTSSLAPKGDPKEINSGVKLDVLPSIGNDGETILLALHPTITADVEMKEFGTIQDYDNDGKPIKSFAIKLPEMKEQTFSARVAVKSGQTVAMGGVLERKQETYTEGVPVLSSIPYLGNLFRKRSEIDKPRYLLIFVTATIISDSGEYIIPKSHTNE